MSCDRYRSRDPITSACTRTTHTTDHCICMPAGWETGRGEAFAGRRELDASFFNRIRHALQRAAERPLQIPWPLLDDDGGLVVEDNGDLVADGQELLELRLVGQQLEVLITGELHLDDLHVLLELAVNPLVIDEVE